MIIEGSREFTAPRERLWEFIVNPAAIGRCLPDLKSLDIETENKSSAVIRVGVGPIRSDFKFKIEIVEKQPISRVRLKAVGNGSGGSINLDTEIELRETTSGSAISYKSDVKVGGMMAGLGQRLIDDTAEKTMAAVFECIKKQVG
jgi:carbon monoxide dehydrogenase subunit G